MTLPKGTAQNGALLENVFVMLVCLLNKIPVFLVGKPGCSKSLSMKIISQSLRGEDSNDPFFRRLPQLFEFRYQGSEDSTSQGIRLVFEQAKKNAALFDKDQSSRNTTSISYVLMDEVGLAEVSRHNPLKVLHALIEPDVCSLGGTNAPDPSPDHPSQLLTALWLHMLLTR